jgi:hypothetical protein
MAIVLEMFKTEEQHSVVPLLLLLLLLLLLWAKEPDAKDIHKEMFSLYGGKCLSLKAVHNSLMMKRLKRRCRSG